MIVITENHTASVRKYYYIRPPIEINVTTIDGNQFINTTNPKSCLRLGSAGMIKQNLVIKLARETALVDPETKAGNVVISYSIHYAYNIWIAILIVVANSTVFELFPVIGDVNLSRSWRRIIWICGKVIPQESKTFLVAILMICQ